MKNTKNTNTMLVAIMYEGKIIIKTCNDTYCSDIYHYICSQTFARAHFYFPQKIWQRFPVFNKIKIFRYFC